jgi:ligand-binding sensor domain-containing protein
VINNCKSLLNNYPQLKHLKILGLILFSLFFILPKSFSQTTYLPHFTSKNGLASNNCYYILQDKKGFIWIATDGGLSRFDGTNFQNFSIEDGLPDTQILQIKEDKLGRLWFLTLNGQIGYLYEGKFYNQDNSEILKKLNFKTIIISFLEDTKGNIWFGTNTNLIIKFDGKTINKYVSSYPKDKFTNAFIHEDSNGNILSFSSLSVQQFDGKQFKLINLNVHPLSYKNAYNTNKKALVFIDKNGLKKYSNNNITALTNITSDIINTIDGYFYFNEKTNDLWISSINGVIHIDSKGVKTKYLNNISINQTIKDEHNNLWFATSQGIYMLPNNNARLFYFDKTDGLSSNNIKSITEDNENNLWLGTDNGYINRLNVVNHKITPLNIPDKKKFINIKQITFDKRNQSIYFASDYGLGVFKNTNISNPQINYLKESNNLMFVIKHFSLNSTNNQLALALSSGVVFLTDRVKNLEFNSLEYKEKEDFFTSRSYHAFYDKDGTLWFSNINGLSQFINGKLIKHYEKTPLLTKRINDIKQLNDGTFVLATDGYGILFLKNDKIIKQITKNQGLASDICTKLFIKNNEIWVLSNSGVNKISNYNQNINITNFDYGKELLEDVNNIFVNDSTAFFASNKGLITFNYNSQNINKTAPKIYITAIRKDKERIPVNSSITEFEYENKTILITFSAVDFTTTDITYRYRLNDSSDWIETRTRRLDFSSLKPGTYTFEVSAKNQNGIWSSAAKKSFIIKKPFWQNIWLLSAFVLLIGYLFYKLAVFITRKQKDKEQEELMVKNKILMLEQQALQAMMNPHFVFNVMNSIQHYINTQNTASANKVLTGFAKLIRKNLEICTKSYITLEEEIEYLSLYLKLEKYRFGDKLNYNIYIDENIDKDETLIPSMLLQPYVENAIWHGIMPDENGGNININLSLKDKEKLIIEIIDNGVGIDNSIKAKKGTHQSKGMKLTQERLNLLGQIEAKPIQLSVVQNSNKGTTVYISIPIT